MLPDVMAAEIPAVTADIAPSNDVMASKTLTSPLIAPLAMQLLCLTVQTEFMPWSLGELSPTLAKTQN